jgi:flagella basal body P-ring formation protein FlgA
MIKKISKLSLVLSLCFASVTIYAEQSATTKTYYLKPKVILKGTQLKASDLLNWKGAVDPILYSQVNSPRYLNTEEILDRLEEIGPRETGTESLIEINGTNSLIVPLVAEWGKSELEQSLISFLKKEINFSEDSFRIYYEAKPILMPKGDIQISWRKIGKNFHGGKRIFPLDVHFQEKLIYSVPVSFLIEEKKEAWFTKREIEPKEILQEYDVEKRYFFTSDNNTEYDLENPVGKTALNGIPEGTALQRKQTRRLHMIERGSEVNLVYTSGNIMIKVRTRALLSGNEGEEIELLNLSSNRKLKGKIQSAGICYLEDLR